MLAYCLYRPSGGGEGGGVTPYQCLALRRHILSVCQTTMTHIQSLTHTLVLRYPVNGDLDETQQYLAFRNLVELYEHFDKDLEAEEAEGRRPCLSLESLKVLKYFIKKLRFNFF